MSGHGPSVILDIGILKPIACGSKFSVQTDHVVPRYVLFLYSLRVENDTANEISDDISHQNISKSHHSLFW